MLPRRLIPCRHHSESLERGFTLIEGLVGLMLIGVVMLLTMSLLAMQPGIERRIAGHRDALQALEMELEKIRSTLVLPEGELDVSELPRPSPAAADKLHILADVESEAGRFLYRVRLRAIYFVDARPYQQVLESMVFAPP